MVELGGFELGRVHCVDCLEALGQLPDKSVDLVLTDPPYGVTDCEWDTVLDMKSLLATFISKAKPSSPVVMFGRGLFASSCMMSGKAYYKHKWIWNKLQSGSFHLAKYMPLQIDEDIVVFADGACNYYPIMRKGVMRKKGGASVKYDAMSGLDASHYTIGDDYFPSNILTYKKPMDGKHPTQKPVELMAYLIETYSKPSDLILDPFMGSGTTGVAAVQLGRRFLGFEIDPEYCRLANERIEAAKKGLKLNEYRQGQQTLFQ